ncbi:MAG: tRNA (adenosine(37)-N6)-threonylcarbamoyltransferase complex dimerization subunit type 1 TsaB [Pseudomonadota bacterium]
MRILAIETSTEHCSVALYQAGEVLSRGELAGQRHSEILLGMIERLLNEAGSDMQYLDGIAFGAGPGSFTGVRIAASVAQGLAFGLDIPVLPVCTLEALAEAAGQDRIACALDARLDEVYFAAYERADDHWRAVVEPCLSAIGELPMLPGRGWAGVGSGFAMLDGELGRHLQLSDVRAQRLPEAAAVAVLGARGLLRGDGMDAAAAQPMYLRDKVAMTVRERHALGYK